MKKKNCDKKNRMKVLLINYGPKPLPATKGGGVETLIEEFYINYTAKIDLSVASYYYDDAFRLSKEVENVNFIYVHQNWRFKISQVVRYIINKYSKKYYGNAFIVKLRKKINFNDYDIIVSENGINMGMYLEKYFDGKIVLHLHNDFLNIYTKNSQRIKESYDQIWTLSKFVKNRVETVSGNTITKTLYNGVDLNAFSKQNIKSSRNVLRRKYGIHENDVVFAYCGRLVEEKGVQFLVRSFNKLSKKWNNIWLLIIGDNSDKNIFIEELTDMANERVIFTGYVSHDKMPEMMSCADVGVAPTVHLNKYFDKDNNYCGIIEGFNLTVIEFMGLGKPVIVTDSGGMPELLSDDTGMIIDSNENNIQDGLLVSMETIIEEKFQFDSEKIVERARNFSLERYVDTFERYLEDVYEN